MATTPNPMGLLAAEMRRAEQSGKRRRVDEEPDPDEEPDLDEISAFPVEVQLAIVERVEARYGGVIPESTSQFILAARVWRDVYDAWRVDRARKMEHPPSLVDLSLARLFVSPRFKLISSMHWRASKQILMAYKNSMRDIVRPRWLEQHAVVLVIFRRRATAALPVKWITSHLTAHSDDQGDPIVLIQFHSRTMTPFGGTLRVDLADMTAFDTSAKLDTGGKIYSKVGQAPIDMDNILIYGRVYPTIQTDAYHDGCVKPIVKALFEFFKLDAARFAKPTRGMLSLKDKMVFMRVIGIPVFDGTMFVTSYYPPGVEEDANRIRVELTIEKLLEHMGLHGDPRVDIRSVTGKDINEFADVRIHDVLVARGLDPPFSRPRKVLIELPNMRPNLRPVVIRDTDDKENPHGPLGENWDMFDLLAHLRKPLSSALSPLADDPEWGYEMTAYPHEPTIGDPNRNGMMMMPLPWLFYLMLHDTYGGWDRFTLGLHTFVFDVGAITIATIDSERVLTHQPYESIVLWDDMDDGEVEDLALLQRKDIVERATAPLVVPEDDIEML